MAVQLTAKGREAIIALGAGAAQQARGKDGRWIDGGGSGGSGDTNSRDRDFAASSSTSKLYDAKTKNYKSEQSVTVGRKTISVGDTHTASSQSGSGKQSANTKVKVSEIKVSPKSGKTKAFKGTAEDGRTVVGRILGNGSLVIGSV